MKGHFLEMLQGHHYYNYNYFYLFFLSFLLFVGNKA